VPPVNLPRCPHPIPLREPFETTSRAALNYARSPVQPGPPGTNCTSAKLITCIPSKVRNEQQHRRRIIMRPVTGVYLQCARPSAQASALSASATTKEIEDSPKHRALRFRVVVLVIIGRPEAVVIPGRSLKNFIPQRPIQRHQKAKASSSSFGCPAASDAVTIAGTSGTRQAPQG